MRYNGGKQRIAKKIAALLRAKPNDIYWEPFCGVCSVGMQVQAQRKFFSDADAAVVSTIQAAIDGLAFPTQVTEFDYKNAKLLSTSDPLHGFYKYGCSFAGKPWGGFARSGARNYALNAANSLKRYSGRIDMELFDGEYSTVTLPQIPSLLYCDPPYKGTTSVGCGGDFDSVAFWLWAERQAQTARVFVSEYQAPAGWKEVFSEIVTDGLVPKGDKRVERLFTL